MNALRHTFNFKPVENPCSHWENIQTFHGKDHKTLLASVSGCHGWCVVWMEYSCLVTWSLCVFSVCVGVGVGVGTGKVSSQTWTESWSFLWTIWALPNAQWLNRRWWQSISKKDIFYISLPDGGQKVRDSHLFTTKFSARYVVWIIEGSWSFSGPGRAGTAGRQAGGMAGE